MSFAALRGATPLGALLWAAARGQVDVLEQLGKAIGKTERMPSIWSLAAHVAADHKQESALAYCRNALSAAATSLVEPASELKDAVETKVGASGKACTTEAELAALADEMGKSDFAAASAAFADFSARHSLIPSGNLLAAVLCRACEEGSTLAVVRVLRLGAPLTYHALVAADASQRTEVCAMLLRFNVKVPRGFVHLLSAHTQAELCPTTHIVD